MKGNFEKIIQDPRPVVVDFHADWCGPCKIQSPILHELASELGDSIRVIKVDVDKNNDIASRYNIQSVPTLMIFQNGETEYRKAGVHNKSQLINIINKILY